MLLLLIRIRTDNWHDNYGLLLSENTYGASPAFAPWLLRSG